MVCHPGRQHSHQLAQALAEHGLLAEYLTGMPAHRDALHWWQRPLLRQQLETYAVDLDPSFVRHSFAARVVKRIAERTTSRATAIDWSHRAEGWFDRIAARRLAVIRPDIVVCYENSALETFRAARRLGITTVLDAASFHHIWQDRFYDHVESPQAHERIIARKDAEIALADYVLTVSALARESYLENGCPPSQVRAITIGVDSTLFVPRAETRGGVSFVFLGSPTGIKGWDLIQSAVRRLRKDGKQLEITAFGTGPSDADADLSQAFTFRQRVSHADLAKLLPEYNVLLLPSRFDSFGMVVAEAMACGLPVIVSENVGAKEMITPYRNGLVVPVGDAAQLACAMQWFLDHRAELSAMSAAAREAAEAYDWRHYRRRIVEFLQGLTSTNLAATR